jgi:hypothetical protein
MKREKLNDRQKFEKDIRENAVSYTAWLFNPGAGFTTVEKSTKEEILAEAEIMWGYSRKVRPVLINAVRADKRFCAIGQYDQKGYREFDV